MRKLAAAGLLLLGLIAVLVESVRYPHNSGAGSGFETSAIARSLVKSGTFANPFGGDTGPSAQQGPVYPGILAAVLWLTDDGPSFAFWMFVVVALMQAAQFLLLPRLSERLFGTRTAGYVACAWMVVIPTLEVYRAWSDASLTPLALMAFCLLFFEVRTAASAAWAGAFGGLIALLHPSATLATLPWFAGTIWKDAARWRRLALFGLTCALVCLPWLVRNYRVFGEFVPIRDNFGLEFQLSNNDLAKAESSGNTPAHRMFHPNLNPREWPRVKAMGEVQYFHMRQREAMEWIEANRARFLELTAWRVAEFWFPDATWKGAHAWTASVITILSVAGLLLARGMPGWGRILAVLAVYPLPLYLIQSDLRYRFPILWVSLLPACYALTIWGRWVVRKVRPVVSGG